MQNGGSSGLRLGTVHIRSEKGYHVIELDKRTLKA